MKSIIYGYSGNEHVTLGELRLRGDKIVYAIHPDCPDASNARDVLTKMIKASAKFGDTPARWLEATPYIYNSPYLRAKFVGPASTPPRHGLHWPKHFDAPTITKDYDESQHPRDESGKWTAGGGSVKASKVAEEYMRSRGEKYEPLKKQPIDPERSKRVAAAYDAMPNTPDDPETLDSYHAMADEAASQYRAMAGTGIKIEAVGPGQADPYASANDMIRDVNENNHMWYYPTTSGFGPEGFKADERLPMLQDSGIKDSNGRPMQKNDVFRVVHDYFGHAKDGNDFRPEGEENAWRSHSAMFSPKARRVMTTETRGQTNWVYYGPYGEQNRAAKDSSGVHFADQKIGLLPEEFVQKAEFDESKHPRDEGGKFSESGGGAGIARTDWKQSVTPQEFITERDKNPRVDFMSHLNPEDLKDSKIILSEDGLAGATVAPDGDIQNVFRNPGAPKGSGTAAALEGVKRGGIMLDCYDYERKGREGLPDVYRKAGFVETGRMKFNPAYRPQWGKERSPDVVFMAYVGGDQSASPKATNYYASTEWDKAKSDSATRAAQRTTKSSYDQETEKIQENKKRWTYRTHRFLAAEWTHPNGHPRCSRCGDEEPIDGLCMPRLKKWERVLTAWTEKFAEDWNGKIKLGEAMSWVAEFHSKCVAKSEACKVQWPACPVGKSDTIAKYITRHGSQYQVHAESGKVLGTHGSRTEAEAQLRAIEANKHNKSVEWPMEPSHPDYGKKPIEGDKAPNQRSMKAEIAPDDVTIEALQKALTSATKSDGLVFKSESVMAEPVGPDVYRVDTGVRSYTFLVQKSVVGDDLVVEELSFYAPDVPFVPVQKAEKQRYTLGAVYAPGEVDFHGDTMTEAELEKAAWAFARKDGLTKRVGLMHQSGTDGAGDVVESYIYRGPVWKFKDTAGIEQTIMPGTWMLGTVWGPEAWTKVERGAVKGYSLQGVARKFANGEEV